MRPFRYHRPTTVAETADLIRDLGDDAALLAGGTSVMLTAKMGLAEPEHVIALRGVRELYGLSDGPVGALRLGAMTTIREVETSATVRQMLPGLAEAAHHVATVRIRNQATLGGNLVHADPNQDLPPMLMVYDAVAEVHGHAGVRAVPVSELFVDFFETVVEPGEIVHSVRVPPAPPGMRTGYLKFLPRTRDDYSTIAVAAGITLVDGRFQEARIAVAGGGATTVRCGPAERGLTGESAEPDVLAGAADLVVESIDPVTDGRGSSRYKTEMARVCTQRLLERLVAEARS
jgi:carbon-monoxide dehydrogenase medium subunit